MTYPDGTSEEVPVTIVVKDQKDTYTPTGQNQTVNNGDAPTAQGSISNVAELPANTRFEWKETPNTSTKGNHDATVVVTYPDGTSEEVPVTFTVKIEDFKPAVPKVKVPVESFGNLTKEEQDKVKESVEKANPGKTVVVEPTGKVTITDPKTNTNHEISEELVTTIAPPVEDIPEFDGGVNGEPEVQPELPEFNGGVNGELPDPVELPKVQLIITKWIDEDGRELKAADVKTPKVLGEANEALEAGEIAGYVFVRTETKDDVVTHIFRKVTPTSPKVDENIKPKSTAKVEKSTKRLANTGEAETNTGLAGLGLGILGSLLAVAKRRRKDEE